jgi:recombination protein RecA
VIYGRGIVRSRDLVNTGEALGLITRSGSWYSFESERLGQGIGNSAQALEEDTELAERLEAAIREKAALGATLKAIGADDAEEE